MKEIFYKWTYCLILLLLVFTACSYADTKDKKAALGPLEYSFSVRRDDVKYETVKIYNISQETIKISNIIKECSCIDISYQPGPIAPNEHLEIELTLNAIGLQVKDSETRLLIKYTLDKDNVELNIPVKIKYKVLPKQEEGNVYALPNILRLSLSGKARIKRILIIKDDSGNAIKLQKVYVNTRNIKVRKVIKRFADNYIIAIELFPKIYDEEILPIIYIRHENGLIKVPISIRKNVTVHRNNR